CEQNEYSVICCTHSSFLKSFYNRIRFPLIIEHAFKYEPEDPLPVNFYFANHDKLEVANVLKLLDSLDQKNQKAKLFKALEITAPVLPIPIYWHNRDGVVLGINEHCLKAIGTSREIIGKTP